MTMSYQYCNHVIELFQQKVRSTIRWSIMHDYIQGLHLDWCWDRLYCIYIGLLNTHTSWPGYRQYVYSLRLPQLFCYGARHDLSFIKSPSMSQSGFDCLCRLINSLAPVLHTGHGTSCQNKLGPTALRILRVSKNKPRLLKVRKTTLIDGCLCVRHNLHQIEIKSCINQGAFRLVMPPWKRDSLTQQNNWTQGERKKKARHHVTVTHTHTHTTVPASISHFQGHVQGHDPSSLVSSRVGSAGLISKLFAWAREGMNAP